MIGKKKVFTIFLVYLDIRMVNLKGIMTPFGLMSIRGPSPSRVFVTIFMLSRVVPNFPTQDHFELNRSSESLIFAWQSPNK